MRKRRRRKKRFWSIWRLIVAMSICLNLFGLHTHIKREFVKQPAVKRHAVLLIVDGVERRVRLTGKRIGF